MKKLIICICIGIVCTIISSSRDEEKGLGRVSSGDSGSSLVSDGEGGMPMDVFHRSVSSQSDLSSVVGYSGLGKAARRRRAKKRRKERKLAEAAAEQVARQAPNITVGHQYSARDRMHEMMHNSFLGCGMCMCGSCLGCGMMVLGISALVLGLVTRSDSLVGLNFDFSNSSVTLDNSGNEYAPGWNFTGSLFPDAGNNTLSVLYNMFFGGDNGGIGFPDGPTGPL